MRMKKTVAAVLCALAAGLLLMTAGLAEEEKIVSSGNAWESELGGVIYAWSEHTPEESRQWTITLADPEGTIPAETADIMQMEFLSGPDGLVDLFAPAVSSDGIIVLEMGVSDTVTAGEARYRLSAESAHFTEEFEFTVTVMEPESVRVIPRTTEFEIQNNTPIQLSKLTSLMYSVEGAAGRAKTEITMDGEKTVDSEVALLKDNTFTARQAGRYELNLRVSPGIGYAENLPISLYTPGYQNAPPVNAPAVTEEADEAEDAGEAAEAEEAEEAAEAEIADEAAEAEEAEEAAEAEIADEAAEAEPAEKEAAEAEIADEAAEAEPAEKEAAEVEIADEAAEAEPAEKEAAEAEIAEEAVEEENTDEEDEPETAEKEAAEAKNPVEETEAEDTEKEETEAEDADKTAGKEEAEEAGAKETEEGAETEETGDAPQPTLPPVTLVADAEEGEEAAEENGEEPRPTLHPVTLVETEEEDSEAAPEAETGEVSEAEAGEPDEETEAAETEEDAGVTDEDQPASPEESESEETEEDPGMTVSIYGPERMRAGSKKYFKARYAPKNPKRIVVTWSLDCSPEVAQVFKNGQIWVRPKAEPGTIITLTCHAEGKDFNGEPWVGETSMQVEITPKKK